MDLRRSGHGHGYGGNDPRAGIRDKGQTMNRNQGVRRQGKRWALLLVTALVLTGIPGIAAASDNGCTVRVENDESVTAAITALGTDGPKVICVEAGDYKESITIDRPNVTLRGLGEVTITAPGKSPGVQIRESNVTLSNLAIKREGEERERYGIELKKNGHLRNIVLQNVRVEGHDTGLKVESTADVDGLIVENSRFDENEHGWYVAKSTESTDSSTLTNVSITNTRFSNNSFKGLYIEKLKNAEFDRVTVTHDWDDPTHEFRGIEINLKFENYSNIVIKNSTIEGKGESQWGATESDAPAALAIKARDDGASYSGAAAATLQDVRLEKVTVSGGFVGVRFGEPGKLNKTTTDIRVVGSNLSGSLGLALANNTTAPIDARGNWWDSDGNPAGHVHAFEGAGEILVGQRCANPACEPVSSPPPPPPPPVTGDSPPPPPPVVTPPAPSTPPVPITVPPGQTVQVPRGGSTAFVGGQPAPVTTVTPPAVPPPTQRTPQQVTQVQQSANQIVGGFQSTRPANSTTPPPVTVTPTDTGANVVGLLSSPTGQSTPVPAENVTSVSAGGTTALVTGADGQGNPLPLGPDGEVPAPQGGTVGTAVGGLTPNSQGQVVAFSDPQLLGTFTADEDGVFRGQIPIPHWLEPGDHTLVINGQGAQGEITLAMSITVAGSDVFSDVAAGSTHGVAISRLKLSGITQGYGDGTYRPSESIGRAQMAAFLARALDLDTDIATTDLSDVAGVHAGAIAAVVDAGVATGYPDGTFKPSVSVTRGQMARFLANAAGLDDVADGELSDVSGAHAGAINAVVEAGLANGHTDGTFGKDEYVNRAQMATFVMNLVDYLTEAAED